MVPNKEVKDLGQTLKIVPGSDSFFNSMMFTERDLNFILFTDSDAFFP